MSGPTEDIVLSDEFLDSYGDTIPGRCCVCPSCNYYAPDYADHQGEPCQTLELIRTEIAAHVRAAKAAAHPTTPGLCPCGQSGCSDEGAAR